MVYFYLFDVYYYNSTKLQKTKSQHGINIEENKKGESTNSAKKEREVDKEKYSNAKVEDEAEKTYSTVPNDYYNRYYYGRYAFFPIV